MSKESVMREFGLTEQEYYQYKEKAHEKAIRMFGKSPKEMSCDELLFATSCVSNELHAMTGEQKYKDAEMAAKRLMEQLYGTGKVTRRVSKE